MHLIFREGQMTMQPQHRRPIVRCCRAAEGVQSGSVAFGNRDQRRAVREEGCELEQQCARGKARKICQWRPASKRAPGAPVIGWRAAGTMDHGDRERADWAFSAECTACVRAYEGMDEVTGTPE